MNFKIINRHIMRERILEDIYTFTTLRGHKVRLLKHNGIVYVAAADICKALDIPNSTIFLSDFTEGTEKAKAFLGTAGAANVLTWAGLQKVLKKSHHPLMPSFDKWITSHWESVEHEGKSFQEITPPQVKIPEIMEPEVIKQEEANNTGLKLFSHETFGAVRVIDKEGEPWFVAKDIAEALGYANSRKAVDDHCKKVNKITQSNASLRTPPHYLNIIPKSDVFRLIMRSNLPAAEAFQDWVIEEVLPSIEKTGGYIQTSPTDTPEVIMAKALHIADATIKSLGAKLEQAHAQMEQDAPKVAFAEQVEGSEDSIPVGILAKLLKQNGVEIGRDRLFKKLGEDGFLIKEGKEKHLPTQRSMNAGYMEIKESIFNDYATGYSHIKKQTLITGKGQRYFMKRYLE